MDYKTLNSVDACYTSTGRTPGNRPDVSMLLEADRIHFLNKYDRMVITEAINLNDDGTVWIPNYNDGSRKYDAWFEIEANDEQPSGFGFSLSNYAYWCSTADAGSRLCFRSVEHWRHAVNTFPDVFKEDILSLDRARIIQQQKAAAQ